MKSKLALLGGEKAIPFSFSRYNSIGAEEILAGKKVLESGILSGFVGDASEDFLGGPKVKEFEDICKNHFKTKHAITVNSWTSGLIAAVGSLDINPGDEIIVSPWTMCASATAILNWNAIPVFSDIEPNIYNLDPTKIEEKINSRTKAIMAIDIFGHSAPMDELRKISDQYGLKIISDTAQAPGAIYKGQYAGTLADIGGYSLNYHKHIHTGEGGILVTDDDNLAERMQLIRNHAEAVVHGRGITNLSNMIGYNFRLGEIECAIGIEQIKKLKGIVENRQKLASRLTDGLNELEGITLPHVEQDCTHVYYVYPMKLDIHNLGVSREKICKALIAEGLEGLMQGYANIHMLPMYQEQVAYGNKGFPWNSSINPRKVNYKKGICPVAEELHEKSFLGYEMCLHELDEEKIDLISNAFQKVWSNLDELK